MFVLEDDGLRGCSTGWDAERTGRKGELGADLIRGESVKSRGERGALVLERIRGLRGEISLWEWGERRGESREYKFCAALIASIHSSISISLSA